MSCYVALVLTRERVLEILSLLLTQQHVSTMRFVFFDLTNISKMNTMQNCQQSQCGILLSQ